MLPSWQGAAAACRAAQPGEHVTFFCFHDRIWITFFMDAGKRKLHPSWWSWRKRRLLPGVRARSQSRNQGTTSQAGKSTYLQRQLLFVVQVCVGRWTIFNSVVLPEIVSLLTYFVPLAICALQVQVKLIQETKNTKIIEGDSRRQQGRQCHQVCVEQEIGKEIDQFKDSQVENKDGTWLQP